MRMIKIVTALIIVIAASCYAQTGPNIPLTGSIGVPGSVATLGWASVVFSADANQTLTAIQWAVNFLKVTSSGSLTVTRNLVAPLNTGQEFTIQNITTGGQSIQIIGSSGTGVTIANGQTVIVRFDGTNYITPATSPFYQRVAVNSTPVTQRNILNFSSTNFSLTDSSSPSQSTVDLTTTGVTPSFYTCSNITVDSFGRITTAANGTCSGGGGGGGLTQTSYTSGTRPFNTVFTTTVDLLVEVSGCTSISSGTLAALNGPVSPTIAVGTTLDTVGGATTCRQVTFAVPAGYSYEITSSYAFDNWVEWTGFGGGGGSGTPGGPTGSVQYNCASVFCGINGTGVVFANGSSAPTILTPTAIVSAGGGLLAVNNLSDVANVSTSRTNLGLGTIATQSASAVAITGGTINGTSIGLTTPAAGVFSLLTLPSLSDGCLQVATGVVISTGTGCGSGESGITALTGDVTASGSGSVAATVVRINGGTVPSTVLLASNSSLQPVAATATNVAGVGVLSNSTTGAAGSTFSLTCTSTCVFNALGVTGWAMTLTTPTSAATLSNARTGVHYTFTWTQDATGGRTCTYPSGTVGANACSLTATAITQQTFFYNGTNLIADAAAIVY